jgi:hypothetical protein
MFESKQKKLEKQRQNTLSGIQTERWMLISMLTRAEVAGEPQRLKRISLVF